jgi:hypothetical protein
MLALSKTKKLSIGQREARGKSIQEGTWVVILSAAWLFCWAMIYKFIILLNTHDIVMSINVFPDRPENEVQTNHRVGNEGKSARFPMSYQTTSDMHLVVFWAFLVGGRNFINFLVWRLIVMPRRNKEYKLKAVAEAITAATGATLELDEDEDDGNQLQKVLQNELLFFTGLGIRGALREEGLDVPLSSLEHSNRNGMNDLIAEGIPLSAHRELNVPLDRANNFEKANNTNFWRGFNSIFVGAAESERLLGQTEPPEGQETNETLLQAIERNKHLTQHTFRAYEPTLFRQLRELFKIDTLKQDGTYDSLLHDALESHEEGTFTGGASDAFMYWSSDKRFMVKQMTHAEMKLLLKLLPEYYEHMKDSVDTDGQVQSLLLRVVSCNRIKLFHSTSKCATACFKRLPGTPLQGRIYFMVFENLLYPRLRRALESDGHIQCASSQSVSVKPLRRSPSQTHVAYLAKKKQIAEAEMKRDRQNPVDMYDLKGSWVNRSTLQDGRGQAKVGANVLLLLRSIDK